MISLPSFHTTVGQKWPAVLSISIATTAISMIVFLTFASKHWPGESNGCFDDYMTKVWCYCERPRGEQPGKNWIAQPANTWSNFGFILSSLFMAWSADTKKIPSPEFWNNKNFLAENKFLQASYVAVVAFLGPGSMFMHASLTNWGGTVDVFSMVLIAAWIFMFSIARIFYPLLSAIVSLSIVYVLASIGIGIAMFYGNPPANQIFEGLLGLSFVINIMISIWQHLKKSNRRIQHKLFAATHVSLLLGIAIWVPSRSGGILCNPNSIFQGHAVWHILAALATVFVFFYFCSEHEVIQAEEVLPLDNQARAFPSSLRPNHNENNPQEESLRSEATNNLPVWSS
mmetsp:Transcript_4130/g.6089  ORF Transcript_4130/g.6089 Transcript_4130/m.6089 type:complete len:342 (-) Transcript_4130:120-1145(-)